MDDPESVELIAQQMKDHPDEGHKVGMLGWTAELNLLATIVDVLSEVHATLIQINSEGHKRPPVAHLPRPVSAVAKVEAKQALTEHKQRVKAWTGRG